MVAEAEIKGGGCCGMQFMKFGVSSVGGPAPESGVGRGGKAGSIMKVSRDRTSRIHRCRDDVASCKPRARGRRPRLEPVRRMRLLLAPPDDVPALAIDLRDVTASDVVGFDAVIHLAALSNDPLRI